MLSKKASMLLADPKPNKTSFQAFSVLLFKWKTMYRLEADKKNLYIHIPFTSKNDELRPEIYGDVSLLEQVVYNLVNNAIKYCYWGTKIHIDCKKPNANAETPHILTVSNFGPSIDEKAKGKLYELYYRGDNVSEQHEGLGIGLYISRKIARAHGGNIIHQSVKISEYNVPLINTYLERQFKDKDESLVPKLKSELKKLLDSEIYNEIISLEERTLESLDNRDPSRTELRKDILKSTYKVTFTVEIPSRGE
jgi:signal transduction histidine kinase